MSDRMVGNAQCPRMIDVAPYKPSILQFGSSHARVSTIVKSQIFTNSWQIQRFAGYKYLVTAIMTG
jgi:hypothetical protein